MEKVALKRSRETVDIVRRVGVLTADRVHLVNHPCNPAAIFNPTLYCEEENLIIYARIILGYFTYASAIVELCIPLRDVHNVSKGHYTGEIVVMPDNKYDIWGTEDPRVYTIGGKKFMTYSGRTINYFDASIRIERTLPVTAVYERGKWRKICAFRMPNVVSDKDAFLMDIGGLKLFHRIHTMDEKFYCVVSDVPYEILRRKEFTEMIVPGYSIILEGSKFEDKIGWGPPPIKVGNEYLFLLHGVDAETKWYKVFAILMNEKLEVTAVTPCYIMEPREEYEVYGDRPFTVFPCGMVRIDDRLLILYGAADCTVGIGEIDLDDLLSMLESNRL